MRSIPLPLYKCHKQVRALKIASIEALEDGGAIINPVEDGYGAFEVTASYCHKHHPQVGGYYVKYEDGYESWSPAETFENGYTLVEIHQPPLPPMPQPSIDIVEMD